MAKYHINPETGRVNLCRADDSKSKGCPFGGVDEHYATKDGARAAYEKKNETFDNAPLKKARKKNSSELELKQNVAKWGPAGKGPDTTGLSSDEAFEVRKRQAEDLIADNSLTSETPDEKIAEIAHKAGTPAGFIKTNISKIAHDAKTRERKIKWDAAHGNNAPKVEPIPISETDLEIDAEWTMIPGEGRFKFITSTEGKEIASIHLRDGFYILGARDAAGGFVYFDENSFLSGEDAIEYLKRHEDLLKS